VDCALAIVPVCGRRGNNAVLIDLGTLAFNAFLIARTNAAVQRPHAAA
jgi:hypothetical protein